MKTEIKRAPSILDKVWSKIISARGAKAIRNMNKPSFLIRGFLSVIPLPNSAAIPITKVKSAMFDPITLPKDNVGFPLIAELMPTNNSGMEVEKAIIINATTNSLNLKYEAILTINLTKKPPLTTKTKQEIKNNINTPCNI